MSADSNSQKFRLDLRGLLGIAASILTISTIFFYFYIHLKQPDKGFVIHSRTGVLMHVTDGRAVNKETGVPKASGESLLVGDQVVQIGEVRFEEYLEDRTLTIFDVFEQDEPVRILFKRDGAGPFELYIKRRADSPRKLYSSLAFLFPMVFWAMGTVTVVFLYPRDDRWLLMVLFQYNTALWLSTGFVGFSHEGYSAVLYFLFISMFCPLSIHLHLILPDAPLRQHHRWLLPLLYLASLAMVAAFYSDWIAQEVLYGGVLVAAAVSLILVVLRVFLPSTTAVKIARRAMLYGLAAGLLPVIALTAAYKLNPVGLLASVYDEIIFGVFLLSVPVWLCGYIFAIQKHDLGFFEFRANRLFGIYGFFSAFVALFLVTFEMSLRWGRSIGLGSERELDIGILGLLLSLAFVAAGQPLYSKFQRLVDSHIFNIKYRSSEVIGAFAEKIPTASNRTILREVVVKEILPALLVRQSGLYLFGEEDVEVLYEAGVPGTETQPARAELAAVVARAGQFLPRGPDSVDRFSWVRVALPLSIPEKIIGVWLLGRRDPDDYYAKDDIVLLAKLSNQMGPVIENFKLVEQARKEVEENRMLQEQLIQSQKMEAIGRLSAGVAHDFNNILSVIIGYSNLVMAQYRGDAGLQQSIKSIKDAGERAATLTRQLLAFSRQEVMEAQVTSVNIIVSDVEKMLKRLAGEDIEIRTDLSTHVPNVKIDPGHMGQVIINLVVNARDAMPDGGRILIQTQNAQCRVGDALFERGVAPGFYAHLNVEDSGAGIDPEVLSKIFEPYFTTKEKGTGLGLSTVYGIINQNKGHVFVSSDVGRGTRFDIFFPATASEDLEAESPRRLNEQATFGTETVLLVEDEKSVRAVTSEILQASGYTVIEAEDGLRAVEKFKEHRDTIDLLLTDVVMPRMRGTELARRLLELAPDLRVVYMSGYSEEVVIDGKKGGPRSILVHKPFSPEKLARVIREVLDGRPGGLTNCEQGASGIARASIDRVSL